MDGKFNNEPKFIVSVQIKEMRHIFFLNLHFRKSTKNWCSVGCWVVGIYAWSTIWNCFDLMWPQRPPSEKVPYISEKLDFWWSIPQKITSIGYFGASDYQIIRIRKFFGKLGFRGCWGQWGYKGRWGQWGWRGF